MTALLRPLPCSVSRGESAHRLRTDADADADAALWR
jgi:hypothetical protein